MSLRKVTSLTTLLVMDISGSMNSLGKLAAAKEAARALDLNWKQLKRLSKKRKDALKAAAAALSEKHGMG